MFQKLVNFNHIFILFIHKKTPRSVKNIFVTSRVKTLTNNASFQIDINRLKPPWSLIQSIPVDFNIEIE